MATEKRLINANAFKVFLEGVRQDYIEENTFSSDFAANVIETVQDNYLELAPTVDAVEVVRCKDCKDHNRCEMEDLLVEFQCIENAYCAAGEKKTNE